MFEIRKIIMSDARLELAYKYPFLQSSKELLATMNVSKIESKHLNAALIRVNEAMKSGIVEFTKSQTESIQELYLISYVYSRMLVSATASMRSAYSIIEAYAMSEANRACTALESESIENLKNVCDQMGLSVSANSQSFSIPFHEYIKFSTTNPMVSLVFQKLGAGQVIMDKTQLMKFMRYAFFSVIAKGLPIEVKTIPKEVLGLTGKVDISQFVKKSERTTGRNTTGWIERLLNTPLPDFRHRLVNLILAPYLVNVRNLQIDEAVSIINEYIERCKRINPDTNVNPVYIRYQCNYAKRRGLKPYSLASARELMAGSIDFDYIGGETKEKKDE